MVAELASCDRGFLSNVWRNGSLRSSGSGRVDGEVSNEVARGLPEVTEPSGLTRGLPQSPVVLLVDNGPTRSNVADGHAHFPGAQCSRVDLRAASQATQVQRPIREAVARPFTAWLGRWQVVVFSEDGLVPLVCRFLGLRLDGARQVQRRRVTTVSSIVESARVNYSGLTMAALFGCGFAPRTTTTRGILAYSTSVRMRDW